MRCDAQNVMTSVIKRTIAKITSASTLVAAIGVTGGGPMTPIAATNVEALVIFAIVLSITLVITFWASQRMTGADAFWAAGRSISGLQNGLAISGDYLSAASFLGI